MENSFYDLDYIITLGEKRVDLYLSAYQGVLGRLTNIILIYYVAAAIFLGIIITSVIYTIRLLIPIRVAYLEVSDRYSTNLRSQYEKRFLSSDLSKEKEKEAKHMIDNYLKASYIDELSQAQEINQSVFVSKSSFYYRALIYSLTAIIPYVICIGFHLSRKDDKVQKMHLVYQKKNVNCIQAT